MIILYGLLVILTASLVSISAWRAWSFNDARRRGKLSAGRPTMFDVRHLLMKGDKDLAIEVYCELFQTTPVKAKKDVEELERSLKV